MSLTKSSELGSALSPKTVLAKIFKRGCAIKRVMRPNSAMYGMCIFIPNIKSLCSTQTTTGIGNVLTSNHSTLHTIHMYEAKCLDFNTIPMPVPKTAKHDGQIMIT